MHGVAVLAATRHVVYTRVDSAVTAEGTQHSSRKLHGDSKWWGTTAGCPVTHASRDLNTKQRWRRVCLCVCVVRVD